MAKEPGKPNGHDRQVTDLQRYRKEKEKAARKPPPKPARPSESFLGSNRYAGLILIAAIVIIALLYLGPRFLPR
jgi:hypothetical protein